MPIEFNCPNCHKRLRVADESAGGRAECPSCQSVVEVPAVASGQWRVQSPDGEQFGPVTKDELDGWVAEGRLSTDFRVKHEESAVWQPAARVYPSLLGETTVASPGGYVPPPEENPYASPNELSHEQAPVRPYPKQHRGGTILTFSILGILCCVIFSIAAWVMAATDLAEMKSGRMDPAGRGLTLAGMIIAIVHVGLSVLALVLNVGLALFQG